MPSAGQETWRKCLQGVLGVRARTSPQLGETSKSASAPGVEGPAVIVGTAESSLLASCSTAYKPSGCAASALRLRDCCAAPPSAAELSAGRLGPRLCLQRSNAACETVKTGRSRFCRGAVQAAAATARWARIVWTREQ